MPHTAQEKNRVLARVRRVRGQLDALERALEAGAECGPVLQQITAVRGAINGLMAGVLESHLREEFAQASVQGKRAPEVVEDIVTLVRTYLR
ncbi:formaldehyde-responsive transcriptional repressor FrmR [Dyella sp.]|uniref:formaldehyde-responsive transcriptional repressor FrmR n=1 Tax=Dyella sp. TaxID=1869338 RepID=UPI002ED3DF24